MKHNTSNPMWGGQFSQNPADIMQEINASIGVDKRLYAEDIAGSKAHAAMLAAAGIISKEDEAAIQKGLDQILGEIESGVFKYSLELEDIHMHVESRLAEIIGEAAGRLHTARSRNDQVALDFRMHVRAACEAADAALKNLQAALIKRAEEHADTIMPGFTHLQTAQPVTLGHHLLAYVEMFGRDRARLKDAKARMNECPLGAAALAGTSFPINREATAKALGFAAPMNNSLDAVSDRDFALEFLSAASILSVHLSRMAEEFILWSSAQFAFIRFSDAFSTGSSIMPQKRNPDAAELVRGKAGRVIGDLNALLITLKSLPLAYNKDMQEDKEPVFDAIDTLDLTLRATCGMVADFTADKEAMLEAASSGFATATDLADWLVKNLKLPFRQAHHTTAQIVKLASDQGKTLEQLSLNDLQKIEPKITQEALNVLSVQASVQSRTSFGGTAPSNVKQAIIGAKKRYL